MANVKTVDCALRPPCAKTLWNKTRRAHYVCIIWGNAGSPQPDHDLDPLQYGWKDTNGHNTPVWYPGSAEPDNFFEGDHESERSESGDDGQTEDSDDRDDTDTNSGPEWSDDSDSESDM